MSTATASDAEFNSSPRGLSHLDGCIVFCFCFFFSSSREDDPTTPNRQGNDASTQYASVIFCEDDEQKKIAERIKSEVQRLVDAGKIKYATGTVHTDIVTANPFYPAHEDHQAYLEKNPSGYCVSTLFFMYNHFFVFVLFSINKKKNVNHRRVFLHTLSRRITTTDSRTGQRSINSKTIIYPWIAKKLTK